MPRLARLVFACGCDQRLFQVAVTVFQAGSAVAASGGSSPDVLPLWYTYRVGFSQGFTSRGY